MKMRWLNYILNRRRARFFPWDVLVADVRESEADVHIDDVRRNKKCCRGLIAGQGGST